MAYLLLRQKVAAFNHWKSAHDAHLPAREKAGIHDQQVLRSMENSNDVVLLLRCDDVALARRFFESSDTREVMLKAGVVGKPEMTFLV